MEIDGKIDAAIAQLTQIDTMVREIRGRGEEIDVAAVDRDVDERLQTLTQMIEHSESDAHRLVDETSSVTFPGTKRGRKKAIFPCRRNDDPPSLQVAMLLAKK